MSLKYGILGFLSKWEASGYDLKKEFDDVMSIFWHSHLSQIYPELNKLEKENLITSRVVTQPGKPDKKLYRITEHGLADLKQWLISPPEAPKIKDSFLMHMFFMDNMPVEETLYQLKAYQKEREQRLHKMIRILKERWGSIQDRQVMNARILMSATVLKRGVEQELQYIEWCSQSIRLIEDCKELWTTANTELSDMEMSRIQAGIEAYMGSILALD